MNRDHRRQTDEEKAYGELMEAAKGLDHMAPPKSRKIRSERVKTPPEWRAYARAYLTWLEVVGS